MAKVYFPKMHIKVPASKPHPENTEYKVSIGGEDWGGNRHPVMKVQMVYDGKVAGRRSPSFPIGTDDFERVQKAWEKLWTKYQDDNNEIVIDVMED